MTKIKICGLTRPEDIDAVNDLMPDYAGFVFWPKSSRHITPLKAAKLKAQLKPEIKAVGVFVDADMDAVADLLNSDIIDIAQLHGSENDGYIAELRRKTGKPVIKAFRIASEEDAERAEASPADLVLLDSGAGSGKTFEWKLIKTVKRDYLLAGGLSAENAGEAIRSLAPYGVDVSSMVETDGKKDREKIAGFISAVRKEDQK